MIFHPLFSIIFCKNIGSRRRIEPDRIPKLHRVSMACCFCFAFSDSNTSNQSFAKNVLLRSAPWRPTKLYKHHFPWILPFQKSAITILYVAIVVSLERFNNFEQWHDCKIFACLRILVRLGSINLSLQLTLFCPKLGWLSNESVRTAGLSTI